MQFQISRYGNLNLQNISIWWQRYNGMKLQDFVPKHSAFLRLKGPPEFFYRSLWANNADRTSAECLLSILITTLSEVCAMFLVNSLVWSSSLPRLSWRFSGNVRTKKKIRNRIQSVRDDHYVKRLQFTVPQTFFFPT